MKRFLVQFTPKPPAPRSYHWHITEVNDIPEAPAVTREGQ